MGELFAISSFQFFSQLLVGLINGSFYALLSLGLAVIFGMLNIINFAHGAQYMMGAFAAYLLLNGVDITYPFMVAGKMQWSTVHLGLGLSYWWSLLLAPIIVGIFGIIIERTMLKRLYNLDHLYGLLLTFGLALIIQGLFQKQYGSSGLPYPAPDLLDDRINLGFMTLPLYRAWVILFSALICFATWFTIERTSLGATLRAATENPAIVRTFGVNVPRLITLTYGAGVGLAGLAGVLAAPIYQVSPLMGATRINVVFAVVVIGGMGSIQGAVIAGFVLGLLEGLTKVFYPEASDVVVFFVMAVVLVLRPAGLFGKAATTTAGVESSSVGSSSEGGAALNIAMAVLAVVLAIAPFMFYSQLLMSMMCMAIFALSVNLLLGYAGLLSFGHAMFLGAGAYISAHAAKVWGLTPELSILCGTAAAMILGTVIGGIAIRRQGIYFAMTTLAFSSMVYFLAVQVPFTHGEDGIQGVPRNKLFGIIDLSNQYTMYYFVLTIFVLALLLVHRIIHSPFGEVLKSIRENEPRAISLGYKTDRYKLMAFVLSASICGLAGATKALVLQVASLTDVEAATSGSAVLMTLIGGLGTMLGPVFGAFVITGMENAFSELLGSWVLVIEGLVFVICVMFFRRGIVGGIAHMTGKPL